jgi:hypothetical protein
VAAFKRRDLTPAERAELDQKLADLNEFLTEPEDEQIYLTAVQHWMEHYGQVPPLRSGSR